MAQSLADFLCVILCMQGFCERTESKSQKLRRIKLLSFRILTNGSFRVCGSHNFTRLARLLVLLALLISQTGK